MTTSTRNNALRTYRSLRGGMVVMIVMLAVALLLERMTATCWETSISAYYFTTAHSIFVATLCGIGALLIVYEGSSDTEDVLLNLAGILAFVVAMVPTSRPVSPCGKSGLPPEYQVRDLITNNIWSVIVPLVVVQLLYWWFSRRSKSHRPISPLGKVGLIFFWAVMLVGLAGLILFRERFDSMAHGIAASIMFVAIILTVSITAFMVNRQDTSRSRNRSRYFGLYRFIAGAMIVTLIGVITLHFMVSQWSHWVIFVETFLILEFAAYWAVQTIELWRTPNRRELMPDKDQMIMAREPTQPAAPIAPVGPPATKLPRSERVLRAL